MLDQDMQLMSHGLSERHCRASANETASLNNIELFKEPCVKSILNKRISARLSVHPDNRVYMITFSYVSFIC